MTQNGVWTEPTKAIRQPPDFNRHLAKNTLYAAWFAKLARSNQGGM
jgi:hypothetical protein